MNVGASEVVFISVKDQIIASCWNLLKIHFASVLPGLFIPVYRKDVCQ